MLLLLLLLLWRLSSRGRHTRRIPIRRVRIPVQDIRVRREQRLLRWVRRARRRHGSAKRLLLRRRGKRRRGMLPNPGISPCLLLMLMRVLVLVRVWVRVRVLGMLRRMGEANRAVR